MVCDACANDLHADCENALRPNERPTWCDCQHRDRHPDLRRDESNNQIHETGKGNGPAEATQKKESEASGG